jgi:hypothetical protein
LIFSSVLEILYFVGFYPLLINVLKFVLGF